MITYILVGVALVEVAMWFYMRHVWDTRNAEIDVYAGEVYDMELLIKSRKVALDGLLSYARRVARLDPGLSERMDVLEAEMFGDEE